MLRKSSKLIGYPFNEIVLDTNSFVVLLVGMYDRRLLGKVLSQNRFNGINLNDLYFCLEEFLRHRRIILTPQVLVETGNIIENRCSKDTFKGIILEFMNFLVNGIIEVYIHKNDLLENKKIQDFGFADISVFEASKDRSLITGDWRLYSYCSNKRREVISLEEFC